MDCNTHAALVSSSPVSKFVVPPYSEYAVITFPTSNAITSSVVLLAVAQVFMEVDHCVISVLKQQSVKLRTPGSAKASPLLQ